MTQRPNRQGSGPVDYAEGHMTMRGAINDAEGPGRMGVVTAQKSEDENSCLVSFFIYIKLSFMYLSTYPRRDSLGQMKFI